MSRLPLLTKDEVPAEYRDIFGVGMNLHRQTLHSPKLARHSRQMGLYFRKESPLPACLCEIAILQIAWLARSSYEYSHHLKIALESGVSEDDLKMLATGQSFTTDPVTQLVIHVATQMTVDGSVNPTTFAELQKSFSAEQIIDLLFVTSFYIGFVRFTASLALQVEPEYQTYLDRFPLPK